MFAALSNSGSPALPMKFVATPRPEKKDWKSMVGPSIVALRPPAHSTCATLRPLRSADWAMDSAWSTPGSNAAVRFANGWPLRWKVLLVEPWTPGHAPVARLYQPAPVLGGAWVRRPFPLADVPFFRKSDMVGMSPCAAYRATMSCLMPSAAKNTAFCTGDFAWVFAWADVFTPAELAAPAARAASAVTATTATSVMRLILWCSPLSRLESPTAFESRVRAVPSRAAPRMPFGQPRDAGTRAAASSRSSNLRLPLSQTAPAFDARASLVSRSGE